MTQLLSWAISGPRGAKGRYVNYQTRLNTAYTQQAFEMGEWYKSQVTDAFNRKHGRTGATAKTIRGRFFPGLTAEGRIGTNMAAVYSVEMAGNLNYVLYPIQAHPIPPTEGNEALFNPQLGPFRGRETNFYMPFGSDLRPRPEVEWFQGGEDSHSPDRSWYEDLQPLLDTEGVRRLQLIANEATNLWQLEDTPPVILAEG